MILTLPRLTAPAGRVADGVGRYLDRLARRQRVVSRELDPRWLRQQRRKLRADGSLDIPRLALEARARGLAAMYGELFGRIIHRDGSVTNLGLLGRRVITDAGVAYLAADIGGGANDSNLFKFHGFGTGSTAESAAQTALVTELTTQYATDSTRPTGSQANSTNTYTTVATLSPDATVTITEHGIFTATSAGTMLDRTVFTGVALTGSADSLQATYVLTLPSGG
jgi:hypothetical protein